METQTSAQLLATFEASQWFRSTKYREQEVTFITQLLEAPIYRQNIPNLFEKLTAFLTEIAAFSNQLSSLTKETELFKKSLVNYSEKKPFSMQDYNQKQAHFSEAYTHLDTQFSALKSDLFTFLSGVLMKNKPHISK